MTVDEMVGWHHQIDGHEFEQAPGVGDRQGSLARCSSWGRKEQDTTEQTKNNNVDNGGRGKNVVAGLLQWQQQLQKETLWNDIIRRVSKSIPEAQKITSDKGSIQLPQSQTSLGKKGATNHRKINNAQKLKQGRERRKNPYLPLRGLLTCANPKDTTTAGIDFGL